MWPAWIGKFTKVDVSTNKKDSGENENLVNLQGMRCHSFMILLLICNHNKATFFMASQQAQKKESLQKLFFQKYLPNGELVSWGFVFISWSYLHFQLAFSVGYVEWIYYCEKEVSTFTSRTNYSQYVLIVLPLFHSVSARPVKIHGFSLKRLT